MADCTHLENSVADTRDAFLYFLPYQEKYRKASSLPCTNLAINRLQSIVAVIVILTMPVVAWTLHIQKG